MCLSVHLFNKCYHNYCVVDRVYLCTNSCVEHVEICRSDRGRKKGVGCTTRTNKCLSIQSTIQYTLDPVYAKQLFNACEIMHIHNNNDKHAHTQHTTHTHTHRYINTYVCIYLIWKAVLLVSAGCEPYELRACVITSAMCTIFSCILSQRLKKAQIHKPLHTHRYTHKHTHISTSAGVSVVC